ncbi:metallophosphoesterase [Priestia flexa]|uniref:Phosphoesterase n=1 Tax=Priestia flexa TaxID=86664 RepID=A0A8I1SM66_9BACI|nr:metallophosphoesterase [Priestia flexa]MBN8250610.1 metallophosphoesterase [Priestia flexa]MBN8432568.1 metallophosphoesterase [Priestia flexa]MCA0965447.1 metallophosphoesterase [Priestia flexa]MCM3064989.1 metallophosphoesterase [Priestia flexa]MCP1190804.1 metallophosphoesterase [Priestia flexa]
MKLLIVSDSHGLQDELIVIKERHADVDKMIHCGDSELLQNSKEMANFLSVRGNCDYDASYVNDRVEKVGEATCLVTHGHLYNVKMSMMNLHYKAREVGANVACFGHSHVAGAEVMDGVLFINPGSILLPRMRKERTYAILEVEDNEATVQFYDISGEHIPSMQLTCTLA